jgi:small redox-active disulfide protein 2
MIIEVCGTGCPRCQATKAKASKALQELGMKLGEDAMVTEIKDVKQISARGVIITPAVVIDGVKVCEGRIPSTQEIKKWIEERKQH